MSSNEEDSCNDDVLDTNEICEGFELRGKTCVDEGFSGGLLKCNNCQLDTSDCIELTCGNGKLDPGEVCDGDAFEAGSSCAEEGFTAGILECKDCSLVTEKCSTCGNDVLDFGEACDGLFISEEESCDDGSLSCSTSCEIDRSNCRSDGENCGNSVIDSTEECDGSLPEGETCTSIKGVQYEGNLDCVDCKISDANCTLIEIPEVRVSVGNSHRCELRSGRIECIDGLFPIPDTVQDTPIVDLSSGSDSDCVITEAGKVLCWGEDSYQRVTQTPRLADYQKVSTAHSHNCALRIDGTLECWGRDEDNRLNPPSGSFVDLSCGSSHCCARTALANVVCWGFSALPANQLKVAPAEYESMDVGGSHACGVVKSDKSILCWGLDQDSQASPPSGTFDSVAAGFRHSCAIGTDKRIVCWGRNSEARLDAPDGLFTQIAAGGHQTCAVNTDGEVLCWGRGHE